MATKREASEPAEVRDFRRALGSGPGRLRALAGLFDKGPITVARAPARLDVMGGIADYSGAHVCEYPIGCGVAAGVQTRRDRRVRVVSAGVESHGLASDFEIELAALYRGSRLRSYEEARRILTVDPRRSWAAYVVGSLFTLLREKKITALKQGLNIGLLSCAPMNVGVASSAAVEVAALYAMDRSLGLGLDPVELGRLGQVAENRVVGAPCGVMDQLTSSCGKENQLLHILCRPHTVLGAVETPRFCAFAGINSAVKHSVGGARYTDTRVATFMGRKILFDRLRRTGGLRAGEDPFGGYLCGVGPEAYAAVYRGWLPARISGAAFLRTHKTTEDPVAPVDPKKTYHVESRTSHPIYESWRVERFITLLDHARVSGDRVFLRQAGELMYASHWSYARKCGMSCREVDFIVNAARRLGPERGVYGAKITGGGSGGTVAVMGERRRLKAAVQEIVAAYNKAYGIVADVFTGSSLGAFEFGSVTLRS